MGLTLKHIPSKKVLKAAAEKKFKEVIILGQDSKGEYYHASSTADAAYVIYQMELLKQRLLDGTYE